MAHCTSYYQHEHAIIVNNPIISILSSPNGPIVPFDKSTLFKNLSYKARVTAVRLVNTALSLLCYPHMCLPDRLSTMTDVQNGVNHILLNSTKGAVENLLPEASWPEG